MAASISVGDDGLSYPSAYGLCSGFKLIPVSSHIQIGKEDTYPVAKVVFFKEPIVGDRCNDEPPGGTRPLKSSLSIVQSEGFTAD